MKKYLFIILVPFLLTIGLTGCYTVLLTTDEYLPSDSTNNPIVIFPVPIPGPSPVWPRPIHPLPVRPQPIYPHPVHPHPINPKPPVYSPTTPPSNPGNKRDIKQSRTTLRNDNGGRGSEPRNTQTTPTRTRTEPTNTSSSSNGNRVESANSGNNSSSRTGNTNNNTTRNNNGSRNTSGG